jgi:hypothetical protein
MMMLMMLEPDRPPPPSPRAAPTVWQSHAHAAAVKADPSYPAFVQDCKALATKPVYEVHVPFSGNLQRILEAPVTEVDLYKIDDVKVNPAARPVAEMQEMILRMNALIESFQLPGFIALCWGVDIDDETKAVTLGGWGSIEVSSCSDSLSFHSRSCKVLNSLILFDRTTCVWARWTNITSFWTRPKRYSNT